MRRAYKEMGEGMQSGKFLEAALLGVPNRTEPSPEYRKAYNEGKLVPLLRNRITNVMEEVRKGQTDDPGFPRKPFMKRLLNDVEDKLADKFDLPASYEVRVHSAVGTLLDMGGVDFWVELYDEDKERVLSDFKIDLKSNPEGHMGRMADYLYYCDDKVASESLEAIYSEQDFKDLVTSTARHLSESIENTYIRGIKGYDTQVQQYADLS